MEIFQSSSFCLQQKAESMLVIPISSSVWKYSQPQGEGHRRDLDHRNVTEPRPLLINIHGQSLKGFLRLQGMPTAVPSLVTAKPIHRWSHTFPCVQTRL